VTPELLELINDELARLAKHYAVLVVECDARVHAVFEYRAPLTTVHGRGGTDFRPPLTRKFLRKHWPDLVVYFSDGFGPAPQRSPQTPVVWCLVPGGRRPATWGRVIQMGSGTGR
jgi:predicted metal-dependent peptidase